MRLKLSKYTVSEETLMKGPPEGYSALLIEGPLPREVTFMHELLQVKPTRFFNVTYKQKTEAARHTPHCSAAAYA